VLHTVARACERASEREASLFSHRGSLRLVCAAEPGRAQPKWGEGQATTTEILRRYLQESRTRPPPAAPSQSRQARQRRTSGSAASGGRTGVWLQVVLSSAAAAACDRRRTVRAGESGALVVSSPSSCQRFCPLSRNHFRPLFVYFQPPSLAVVTFFNSTLAIESHTRRRQLTGRLAGWLAAVAQAGVRRQYITALRLVGAAQAARSSFGVSRLRNDDDESADRRRRASPPIGSLAPCAPLLSFLRQSRTSHTHTLLRPDQLANACRAGFTTGGAALTMAPSENISTTGLSSL
jgi:hypothetical protein